MALDIHCGLLFVPETNNAMKLVKFRTFDSYLSNCYTLQIKMCPALVLPICWFIMRLVSIEMCFKIVLGGHQYLCAVARGLWESCLEFKITVSSKTIMRDNNDQS